MIDRLPQLGAKAAYAKQAVRDKIEHKNYVRRHGDDMPEVRDWRWRHKHAPPKQATETAGDNVSVS